ncbi:hypothetical protein OG203_43760 [Nocardia sp. NBC_01499]
MTTSIGNIADEFVGSSTDIMHPVRCRVMFGGLLSAARLAEINQLAN